MGFILQWNCNGFYRHKEELDILICDFNPCCVCLQETHFKMTDKGILKGFNVFRYDDTRGQRAQGGVAIAIREALYTSRLPLNTPFQAVAVTIHVPEAITLCNVYLPEDAPVTRYNLESLVRQLPRPFVLLGDFNAHDALWGSTRAHRNRRGKILSDFILDSNHILLNNGEKTRFNSFNGEYTSIDLCILSSSLMTKMRMSVHDDLCGSDHFPLFIEKDQCIHDNFNRPDAWITRKADWENFKEMFKYIHENNRDASQNIELLTSAIIEAANASVPRSRGTGKRPQVPWWNDECARAITLRKKALRIFNKYPTATNLSSFRRLRAKARRVVKDAKRASWMEFLSGINHKTPLAHVWRKVKSISSSGQLSSVSYLKVDGNLLTTAPAISEAFGQVLAGISSNQNFEGSFRNIKTRHEATRISFVEGCTAAEYNDPFSLWELTSAIEHTCNTSPGLDQVHNAFLRNIPEKALTEVLRTLNQLWVDRDFPSSWRESLVVPIPKQGKERADPKNYRPISLTSCLCKVMERMVNRRLVWLLERRKLLSNIQCGFRRGRSTLDHLVRAENFIQEAFLLRQHVVAVFFDLEKAYDRVWRRRILDRLHAWGLRGNLPIFIQNFLTDRVFKVRIGRHLSQFYSLDNGIPQGSVLSVTLFAIAIDDVVECIQEPVMGSLFVDDLAIFCRSSKVATAGRQLQMTLNRLNIWSRRNGFRFSAKKTKCLHFHRLRGIQVPPNLRLGNVELPFVESLRFLGMIFDRRLNWRDHISDLRERCLKILNILRFLTRTTWGADRSSMILLYRALVRSRLDYGSVVYSSGRDSYLKPLSTVHHVGLRLATGAFRTSPILSLCADAGEPPLATRRKFLMSNYAAKILSSRNHPAHNVVFRPRFLELYNRRPRASKPAGVQLKSFLDECPFNVPEVFAAGASSLPPWAMKRPLCDTHLHRHLKGSTTAEEFQQLFYEFLDHNAKLIPVYTDGSKTDSACACAVVSSHHGVLKRKLSPLCGILTAELVALRTALQEIRHNDVSFVICTDSMSALQTILRFSPSHPIAQEIHVALRSLHMRGVKIIFMWVPGHMGILGNEKADRAAKEALSESELETLLVPAEDLKVAWKNVVLNEWKEHWIAQTGNKLRSVKSDVSAWTSSVRSTRREEVVITRLRIGHCNMTHSYLFTEEKIPPQCDECDSVISVRHFLTECSLYRIWRKRMDLVGCVNDMLRDDPELLSRVIKFLKITGLFNKI